MEVRQGRIAGAEVVDRQANAERLQFAQTRQVRFRVVHHRALGQLDDQIAGFEARRSKRQVDVSHQIALLEMASGHIQVT